MEYLVPQGHRRKKRNDDDERLQVLRDNQCECGRKKVDGSVFCRRCKDEVMKQNKRLRESETKDWLASVI